MNSLAKLGRRISMLATHSAMVPSALQVFPTRTTKDSPSRTRLRMVSTFSHSAPKPDASKASRAMTPKSWYSWTKILREGGWKFVRGTCFSVLPLPKEPQNHWAIWASGIGQLTRSHSGENGRGVFWAAIERRIWFKNLVIHTISRLSIDMSSKTRLSTIFLLFSRIWVYKVYICLSFFPSTVSIRVREGKHNMRVPSLGSCWSKPLKLMWWKS